MTTELTPQDVKLMLIAGNGMLPIEVALAAHQAGRDVRVAVIADENDPAAFAPIPAERFAWGEVGRLQRAMKAHGARDLVIIGGITKRPDFSAIKLDTGAVLALPRILSIARGGDETVLSRIARYFEEQGYRVVGAHTVAPLLCAELGPITIKTPLPEDESDMALALRGSRTAGALDLGQGAVAIAGRLVAMEGAEGTDAMLERVASLRERKRFATTRKRQGVLAKLPRPAQDMRYDIPTIGPRTIDKAHEAGLAGVVLEAGRYLMAEREQTLRRANQAGLFIVVLPASQGKLMVEGGEEAS